MPLAVFEKGTWSINTHTMSTTPVLVNINDPLTTVNNLTPGTLQLIWSITNDGNCSASSDTVLINVTGSSADASAGNDQSLCDQLSTTLNATAVATPNAGTWSIITPASLLISDLLNPKASLSGLTFGGNKVVWTVTNNVCAPKVDTVLISVYLPLKNSIAGSQTICSGQNPLPSPAKSQPAATDQLKLSMATKHYQQQFHRYTQW